MQGDKSTEIEQLDSEKSAADGVDPSASANAAQNSESGVLRDNTMPSLAGMKNTGEMLKQATERSLVGEIIDNQFKMIEILGKGGMSVVYKAQYLVLNKLVAIKLMHPHLSSDTNALKRFKQEAQAASQLDHPNVIKVYGFGITGGDNPQPYIVMDFIEGNSLSEVIRKEGKVPVAQTLKIFIQVCNALAHAHAKGIIHRDLKPSNIMLVEKDGDLSFVKIVDFGIAKMLPQEGEQAHRLTQTGDIFGSPMYMSPEQCMGRNVDVRSDVYALGCVLYECLSGKPPHSSTNVFETFHKHISEIPASLDIPGAEKALVDRLDAVVFKALEKDQDKRYQSMAQFESDLQSIASDLDTGLRGTNLRIGIARQQRTFLRFLKTTPKRALVSILAFVLLALGAAFIWFKTSWFFEAHKFEAPESHWLEFQPAMFAKRRLSAADKQRELDLGNLALMHARAENAPHSDYMLELWMDRAKACAKLDAPAEEIEALNTVLDILLKRAANPDDAKNDPNYAQTAEQLADVLISQGDINKAQPLLEDAEFIRERKSSSYANLSVPRTYLELGYVYYKKFQLQRALIQIEQGIRILTSKAESKLGNEKEALTDSRQLAIAYAIKGDVLRNQQDWESAAKNYNAAQHVINASGYSKADAFARDLALLRAYVKMKQEKYPDACELFEQALPRAQERYRFQTDIMKQILNAYAYAAFRSANPVKAVQLHEQAVKLDNEK